MGKADHLHFLATLTRSYHLLGAVSDQLHAGHGFSPGARSILLLLDRQGPMTMSEIARDRAVSRQLIQRVAAALLENGVIEAIPNAAHRKSAKLGLTGKGRLAVEGMLQRESGVQAAVVDAIGDAEIERAHAVITKLNQLLVQIRKDAAARQ